MSFGQTNGGGRGGSPTRPPRDAHGPISFDHFVWSNEEAGGITDVAEVGLRHLAQQDARAH